MAVIAVRGSKSESGLRPFDPYRDVEAVVDLITMAFGDQLDVIARRSLEAMRRSARGGHLLPMVVPRELLFEPGFVWLDQGRMVGNISLRRATVGWGGFLIGNVAVHPDWRGRGIGRALMEAAFEEILSRGGYWAGLEVRQDNVAAVNLYHNLEFQAVGRTCRMLRPSGQPWQGDAPQFEGLRRGRHADGAAVCDLLSRLVPLSHRILLEVRERDYRIGWEDQLDRWLAGQRVAWWVIEERGQVVAGVRSLYTTPRRLGQIEVLIDPARVGRYEEVLVRQGMAGLSTTSAWLETTLPVQNEDLGEAFLRAGFRDAYTLVQMRLDLR